MIHDVQLAPCYVDRESRKATDGYNKPTLSAICLCLMLCLIECFFTVSEMDSSAYGFLAPGLSYLYHPLPSSEVKSEVILY